MDTKDQHKSIPNCGCNRTRKIKTLPKILIDQHFAYPFDSTVWRCDKR